MTERRLVKLGPPMKPCGRCFGYGVVAVADNVDTCPDCHGGCLVEQRDEHGRYLPWPLIEVEVDEELCDYCGGTGTPNPITPTCPVCLGRGVAETWTRIG